MSPATAAKRSRALRERVAISHERFVDAQIGTERSAVILRRRSRRSGALVALTDNYLKLEVDGPDGWLGRRARVEVSARDRGRLVTGQ